MPMLMPMPMLMTSDDAETSKWPFIYFPLHIEELMAHRQISKKGVSKSLVHVIKHASFQFYRVHPDGVI